MLVLTGWQPGICAIVLSNGRTSVVQWFSPLPEEQSGLWGFPISQGHKVRVRPIHVFEVLSALGANPETKIPRRAGRSLRVV
jgi:hypothetical protein